MKAHVDQETCISCGLCPSICGEVFQFYDSGKARAIVDVVPPAHEDEAKDAEASCPVSAITCEE